MSNIGYATLQVIPSLRGLDRTLGSGLQGPLARAGSDAGDQASKGFSKKLSDGISGTAGAIGRNASKLLAGGLLVGGGLAAAFGKQAIDSASDLNETLSKTKVVLGGASEDIIKWSATTAGSLGQSQQSALDAAATFGVFGKSAGLKGPELGQFSKRMVTLTSDMASFSNTTPDQAIEAVGAALRGESEPIRAYGVLLDDATLRAQALKLGLISSTKTALTPQNKVLAAQAEILRQTTDAQGDFARTADGSANKQRILSAQVDNLKAKLGRGLLPIFSGFLTVVTSTFLPAIDKASTALSGIFSHLDFSSAGTGIKSAVQGVLPSLQQFGTQVAELFTGHLVPLFVNFGKAILPSLVSAGKSLAQIFTGSILPAFRELVDFTSAHVVPVVALVADKLSGFLAFLASHQGAVKTFAKVALGLLVARFAALKVKAAVDGVKNFVSSVKDGYKSVRDFASKVSDNLDKIKSFGKSMLDAGKNALAFAGNVIKQTAAFVAQKVAAFAAAAAQKAMAAAQWLLNVAMEANPIGLIVVGIAALAAGFVLAYQHITPFRNAIDALGRAFVAAFGWVRDHWPLLLGILTGPIGIAVLLIKANWDRITGFASATFNFIKNKWPLLLAILTGPIGLAVLAISKNWDTIKAGVATVFGAVKRTFDRVVAFVTGVPDRIAGAFAGAGKLLYNIGGQIISGLIDGLKDKLGPLGKFLGSVGGFIKDHKGPASKDAKLLTPIGGLIMGGLVDGIKGGMPGLQKQLGLVSSTVAKTPLELGKLRLPTNKDLAAGMAFGKFATTDPDAISKLWNKGAPANVLRAVFDAKKGPIQEDDPRWNWKTMGNHRRGPVPHTTAVRSTVSASSLASAQPLTARIELIVKEDVEHLRVFVRQEGVKGLQEITAKKGYVPKVITSASA